MEKESQCLALWESMHWESIGLLIFDKRSLDDPEFHQSMLDGWEDVKQSQYPSDQNVALQNLQDYLNGCVV